MSDKNIFTPLHRLLRDTDDTFWSGVWQGGDVISYLGSISAIIADIKKTNAKRLFIISQDRAHFLAGFLAALDTQIPIVLPHSNAPGLLQEILKEGDAILTDQEASKEIAPVFIPICLRYPFEEPQNFAAIDPKKAFITFYTSGSTSAPKAVDKTLEQLEIEISALHAKWPIEQNHTVLSSVSHHHIYGLLFSLLWPVCAGVKVMRSTFSYWESLLRYCHAGHIIVSSPAHLGKFPLFQKDVFCASYVFSSGGPLAYQNALSSKQYLGSLPIEIYGSTETGGIAYRQQEMPHMVWRAFENITLHSAEDHLLQITSPYLEKGELFQTQDLVTLEDAYTFHLQGRADRVVKVEGKRVSLTQMEEKLKDTPLVYDAAIVPLERSYRDELGGLLVLSKAGTQKLSDMKKSSFVSLLRHHLSVYFDGVVLPRKWRFVEAIPLNNQGKRQMSLLQKCFKNNEIPTLGSVLYPLILKKEESLNKVLYFIKIPCDLAYFEGHFKTLPVVPGVVQLHWVATFARADFALPKDVIQGNQIKFSNLMNPDDEVCLILEYHPEKKSVSYSYTSQDFFYSSGRLQFSQEDQ